MEIGEYNIRKSYILSRLSGAPSAIAAKRAGETYQTQRRQKQLTPYTIAALNDRLGALYIADISKKKFLPP